MAKKVRTPAPPKRPVQAPKVRSAPRDEQRSRKILYAIAASGLLLLGAVLAFFLLSGGDDGGGKKAEDAVATLRAEGWTYKKAKDLGRTHVPEFQPGFKYNTVPGTSGQHSNQTVIYGAYDQPVSEINLVHNLEHGAVGMFYGDEISDAVVGQMQEYYSKDPNGLIFGPDPRLGDQIALAAWTHLAKGKTFNEEVFDTFIEEFGFKGPESCKTKLEQGCFRREDLVTGGQ